MIKRQLITAFYFLLLIPAFAQEGLRPLTGRITTFYEEKGPVISAPASAYKTQSASLQIPFFDDFYYAATSAYPNMALWSDSTVYVNTGFPIAAPSIGVATFDGLNKSGYPYKPGLLNLLESSAADTLTSRPIDLHIVAASSQTLFPSDSLAISFRYQARGRGEPPEAIDSLILDFFDPVANKWRKVWGRPGNINGNINDTIFKKAYVKIDNANYLSDGFKFRFRNKATTAGDFDHWHLDYIYLNKNRTIADTVFNDITLGGMPAPLLKNYSAMPYKQYIANEKAPKFSVRIKNNSNIGVTLWYSNDLYTSPVPPAVPVNVHSSTGGSEPVAPTNNGSSTITSQSNPDFTYAFPPMTDSTDYMIKHYVYRSDNTTSDFYTANDTVVQYQRFRNYYAFDDGGAEAGYYVNGVGGRMAVKIGLNVQDTLYALRIYFDPVGYLPSAITSYSFIINVWADNGNGNGPAAGPALYTDILSMLPVYYNTGSREYPEYKLSNPPKLPPGTYYVGIQQRVASGLTVGYDMNTNHSDRAYYNSGSGWQQSTLGGALMIRPVFGRRIPSPVGIHENTAIKEGAFFAYPNPASNELIIHCDKTENVSYFLMNTLGQKLKEEQLLFSEQSISTAEISNGVYFLVIKENNRLVQQQKIIIQH